MFELPLFPLRIVLFPGMPLALHIFEDRYKLMIGNCIEERRPFGVVLIKEGVEAHGPLAEPYAVGCTARITQVERLKKGRLNIGAIGHERFRILSLDYDLPYLVGTVERYPLANEEPGALAKAGRRLRPWVVRYMEVLSQIESIELDPQQLPDEPVTLAYLAATLIQIPQEQKQQLLVVQNGLELLTDMQPLYRREVALLKAMLAHQVDGLDSFSVN